MNLKAVWYKCQIRIRIDCGTEVLLPIWSIYAFSNGMIVDYTFMTKES